MRRGAAGAADTSRRMIKRYRGKLRQGKENAIRTHSTAETPDREIGSESVFIDTPMEYAFSPVQTAARNEVGIDDSETRGLARKEVGSPGNSARSEVGICGGETAGLARKQVGSRGNDARNEVGFCGRETAWSARKQVGSPGSGARNEVGIGGAVRRGTVGGPAPCRRCEIGGFL